MCTFVTMDFHLLLRPCVGFQVCFRVGQAITYFLDTLLRIPQQVPPPQPLWRRCPSFSVDLASQQPGCESCLLVLSRPLGGFTMATEPFSQNKTCEAGSLVDSCFGLGVPSVRSFVLLALPAGVPLQAPVMLRIPRLRPPQEGAVW